MTKNDVDINDLIEETYIVPESVWDRKRTKTSHFMLNTIFPNSTLTSTDYFVNAFLGDKDFKNYLIRPLFLLFKVSPKDSKWTVIHNRLITKVEFVLEYFVGIQKGKNLLMMIFQVPEKYKNEYHYFRSGKYSQFSSEYKKLFNKYSHDDNAKPIESVIWKVLHKSPELRKELQAWIGNDPKDYKFTEQDELWGIPERDYEYYGEHQPREQI